MSSIHTTVESAHANMFCTCTLTTSDRRKKKEKRQSSLFVVYEQLENSHMWVVVPPDRPASLTSANLKCEMSSGTLGANTLTWMTESVYSQAHVLTSMV